MGFAIATEKTRLQDFRAIFGFKATWLADSPAGLSQLVKANKNLGNSRISSLRGFEKAEASYRNSRFILGILDLRSLLGYINLAYKFYKGGALNP